VADFVKVGSLGDFAPGSLRAVEVDGSRVVVANVGGRLYAVSNACTHVGLPLAPGYIVDRSIVCPFHGSMFDLESGEASDGPADDPVTVYTVRVDGDDVLVSLD
jgi:3-phenylpropionate/trans-cinnamate dioxygenase ferredoxin subunit